MKFVIRSSPHSDAFTLIYIITKRPSEGKKKINKMHTNKLVKAYKKYVTRA